MTSATIENIDYKAEIRQKTAKPLLWVGLVSIVMFFGGLTSAVIVVGGSDMLGAYELPKIFTISTVVVVVSSILFHVGLISIKKDKLGTAKFMFIGTLILGLTFAYTQCLGWVHLWDNGNGIVAAGKGARAIDSFMYLLPGLHLAHMVGGLISLIVVITKSVKKKYSVNNHLGVQLSITYWHFLGGLWVFLFFFLKYIA